MSALVSLLAIAALIGVLTIARVRAMSSGLRARRQFLRDVTPALEVMGDTRFGLYVRQLLLERGYRDITVAGGVGGSVRLLAASPAGRPALFQCMPNCGYVSAQLVEEIAWAMGDGQEREGYLVTAKVMDRESADMAAGRGLTIVDRPVTDLWAHQARGSDLADLLEAEMPGLAASTTRVVIPRDVLLLARGGRKLEAIKLYRQLNPRTGLKEAGQVILWLSALPDSSAMLPDAAYGRHELPDGGPTGEVASLARHGMRIQAIRRYRQLNPDVKLRDAKSFVDRIH